MRTISAVDLFCGAGGLTNGLKDAAQELGMTIDRLIAINHWEIAIATHSKNNPDARHLCTGIESVDPWSVIGEGDRDLDVLVAGPQCTFFSKARGGRPVTDQQRISPWLILDWLEKLDVRAVLIENVPELMKWGPVKDGRPVRELQGQTFAAYIAALQSLGYYVDHRVLNCANYGDATTRERLFIMARKDKAISWPNPTHASPDNLNKSQGMMRRTMKPWRSARQIIDWSIKGESIYTRKRPLAKNTLRRISVGLEKFSGLPFVLGQQSCAAARSVDEPLPTVSTAGAISVIEPFLVKLRNNCNAVSVDEPLPTLTAGGGHIGLCEPFLIPFYTERDGQTPRVHSVDDPLPTVTTENRFGLVEPFIIPVNHGNDWRDYSIHEPMRTITAVDAWAVIQPFLVQYNGTADAVSIDDPLPTVTTRDRFGIAEPLFFKIKDEVYMLDILFRMLSPHELAASTSFPSSYQFEGNRGDIVKQIGNAVPRMTAKALCKALLS